MIESYKHPLTDKILTRDEWLSDGWFISVATSSAGAAWIFSSYLIAV